MFVRSRTSTRRSPSIETTCGPWIAVELPARDWRACFDEALAGATTALAKDPDSSWGHATLGLAYECLDEYAKAVEVYEKALAVPGRHDPRTPGWLERARKKLAEPKE